MSVAKIGVVIPLYNEAEAIVGFFDDLYKELSGINEASFSYHLVNDGSSDNTQSVLRQISVSHDNVSIIRLFKNSGHQKALTEGLKVADDCDAILMLDGDGQHPASVACELVRQWLENRDADIVQAVRTDGQGASKSLFSDFFYALCRRTISGLSIVNGESDFRIVSTDIRNCILNSPLSQRNMRVFLGTLQINRIRISYVAEKRLVGHSKYTPRKMLRLAIDGLFGFSHLPLRVSHTISLVLFFVSLIFLGQSLYAWVIGDVVSGWTSIIGIICLCFAGVFCVLAILSEYILIMFQMLSNTKGDSSVSR